MMNLLKICRLCRYKIKKLLFFFIKYKVLKDNLLSYIIIDTYYIECLKLRIRCFMKKLMLLN